MSTGAGASADDDDVWLALELELSLRDNSGRLSGEQPARQAPLIERPSGASWLSPLGSASSERRARRGAG